MKQITSIFTDNNTQFTVREISTVAFVKMQPRGGFFPSVELSFIDMEHLEVTLLNLLTQVQLLKAKSLADETIARSEERDEESVA